MVRRPDDMPAANTDDDSVDLWGIAVNSWRLIAACAAAGALAGAIVAAMTPPRYRSEATLRLMPTRIEAITPITLAIAKNIFADPEVSRAVVQNLNLERSGITPAALTAATEVNMPPTGNVFTVAVTLPSADLATRATSAVANRAIAVSVAMDAAEATAEGDALKVQLDRAKTRLDLAEERLIAFMSTTRVGVARPTPAPVGAGSAKDARLLVERARLEQDSMESAKEYRDLAAEYDTARAHADKPVPQLKIVEGPKAADHPLPRHTVRLAALGLATGLFVGISLAILRQAAAAARAQRARLS